MQSFSRCIHFLKASRYADLGTVIRYWWMADPSACRDWYFHPARNAFNFGNKKKITWGKVWGIRRVRQNSFFLQKRRNYCGGMSWGIVMKKTDMFKTSGRALFLIILFQFLQYYIFVALSGDAFALFHWHFYCNSFTREEDCIQNLLCTQRTFGNYRAFAVFSGPDLIANLSDGLKIMDPGFITCDNIGKLLFVIFWKHLKQFFGHFNPLPLLLVSQQIFLTFKCFFKIRWTIDSDMPTFRAISRTVNLASPSMISFILETISLRDDFGLPDFGAFLMDSTPDSNFFFHCRIVS